MSAQIENKTESDWEQVQQNNAQSMPLSLLS